MEVNLRYSVEPCTARGVQSNGGVAVDPLLSTQVCLFLTVHFSDKHIRHVWHHLRTNQRNIRKKLLGVIK